MDVANINWFLVATGVVAGVLLVAFLTWWLGHRLFKGLNVDDRGNWDKPLPEPFPRNLIIAAYKRRKRYHRHDRHHYQGKAR